MCDGPRLGFERLYRYKRLVVCLFAVYHQTVHQSEQSMVFSDAHVLSGVVLGAALAHDDVAGSGRLAAVNLDAQSLAVGFASVLRTTDALLVCHGSAEGLNDYSAAASAASAFFVVFFLGALPAPMPVMSNWVKYWR